MRVLAIVITLFLSACGQMNVPGTSPDKGIAGITNQDTDVTCAHNQTINVSYVSESGGGATASAKYYFNMKVVHLANGDAEITCEMYDSNYNFDLVNQAYLLPGEPVQCQIRNTMNAGINTHGTVWTFSYLGSTPSITASSSNISLINISDSECK